MRIRCLVSILLLWSGLALAQNDTRKASESFRQGQEAYARGEYAAAAAAFENAARLEPHPAALINAADAWLKADDPVRAAEACDRVLALDSSDKKFASDASTRLSALVARIGTLELRGPSTLAVRVDSSGDLVLPARRRLTPGSHRIVAVDLATRRTRTSSVSLGAGEIRTIELEAFSPGGKQPAASAPSSADSTSGSMGPNAASPPSADRGRPIPTGSWIAFGIGGAAAVTSAAFGLMTVQAKNDYDDEPTRESADRFERNRTATNIAAGVAIVAGTVGVVVWLTTPKTRAAKGRPPAIHF